MLLAVQLAIRHKSDERSQAMRTSRFVAIALSITLLNQICLEAPAADLKLSKEHYDKSKLALEQSDLTVALESVNKAIEANPRNASAYYLRASIFARKQDWEAALKDSEKAVEINPDSSVFLTARGDLKFRRGDQKGGIEDLTAAIAKDAKNYRAYQIRAGIWKAMGQAAFAEADMARAIELKPDLKPTPARPEAASKQPPQTTPPPKVERREVYGQESELKGLKKYFATAGGQEAGVRKIIVEYVTAKLPELQLVDERSITADTIILSLHSVEDQKSNRGDVYLLNAREKRMLTTFRYRPWKVESTAKDFASDFVKLYKKTNGLK